jgi:pteridine reductase
MNRPLALVTGGVRRLGAAIAARLAEAGYDLALTSHGSGEPEDALANALKTAGVEWQHFSADLSDPDQAAQLVGTVAAHFGGAPDLLVNNAAMFGQDDWQAMDLASLDAHFRLNLFSPLLLAKALVEAAGEGKQPCIVHVVDQRIVNPNGDQLSYTLSKQALAASVRSMASAYGHRARVNAVAPLGDEMPLGKLPDPRAVADAVLYLAGASHVTGQLIFVDGGASLKSFPRDFMHL